VERNVRRYSSACAALLLIVPLVGSSDNSSSKLRTALIWVAVLGLWAILFWRTDLRPSAWPCFFVRFPDSAAIAFLVWAAVSYFTTTPAGGRGSGLALAEFLRIASSVMLYLGARYAFPTRVQLCHIWMLILVCTVLDSAAGIGSAVPAEGRLASAAYGNKELLAAFLVGFIPFTTVTLRAGPTKPLRRTALTALVVLTIAMVLTGNRTSWLAAIAGLLVAAALTFSASVSSAAHKTANRFGNAGSLVVAGSFMVVIAGVLLSLGVGGGIIRHKLTSLSPGTMDGRLPLWRAAISMIRAHPLMGVGIGAYPVQLFTYSGYIRTFPTAAQIIKNGPSLLSMAHNEYLQTAAELGVVGIALYLAVIVSFFVITFGAWRSAVPGLRRTLLAATISAVVAQCVDALANPGWRYADVAPILWLMFAVGISATRRKRGANGATHVNSSRPRFNNRRRQSYASLS
jgi:hypothetical protein